MKLAWLGIPLVGLVGFASVVAAHEYDPFAAQPAVLKGKTDRADPAVVMIRHGDAFCTASVIAPRYLLTAAHCVNDVDPRVEPITVEGHRIAAVHLPDRSHRWANDIAVLELSTPVSVAPLPLNLDPEAVRGLAEVRLVGYGRTRTNRHDGQTKRTSTARVTVNSNFIEFVPGTGGFCYGDSGGPALVEIDGRETIVGVTSHIDHDRCEDGGGWVRTDRFREFLAPFVGAEPKAPEPKVEPKVQPKPTPTPDPAPNPETHVDTVHVENGSVSITAGPNGVVIIQNGQTIYAGPNGVRIEQR